MFLRRLFAFVVLPSLLAAAAPSLTAETWNAGLDTTKPGWYFEHPVWKQMKADFERRYLGLEAALRAQIPALPDSICLQDSAMHMDRGKNLKWKVYRITDKINLKARFTVLHPTALRARPNAEAAMVGVILPSAAAYRAVRDFSIGSNGLDWFLMTSQPSERTRTDSLTSMLSHGRPWDYFLLADSNGKPLGWAAWDSLVYFDDSATAASAQPFYRDGLADYLDGLWYQPFYHDQPLFSDRPASKTNPLTTWGGELFRMDLRRMLWKRSFVSGPTQDGAINLERPFEIMEAEDSELAATFLSTVWNLKTGKKVSYFDAKKWPKISKLPLHWFFDQTEVTELHPFTLEPEQPGRVGFSLWRQGEGVAPKLVLPFNGVASHALYLELDLPWNGLSKWDYLSHSSGKLNVELLP